MLNKRPTSNKSFTTPVDKALEKSLKDIAKLEAKMGLDFSKNIMEKIKGGKTANQVLKEELELLKQKERLLQGTNRLEREKLSTRYNKQREKVENEFQSALNGPLPAFYANAPKRYERILNANRAADLGKIDARESKAFSKLGAPEQKISELINAFKLLTDAVKTQAKIELDSNREGVINALASPNPNLSEREKLKQQLQREQLGNLEKRGEGDRSANMLKRLTQFAAGRYVYNKLNQLGSTFASAETADLTEAQLLGQVSPFLGQAKQRSLEQKYKFEEALIQSRGLRGNANYRGLAFPDMNEYKTKWNQDPVYREQNSTQAALTGNTGMRVGVYVGKGTPYQTKELTALGYSNLQKLGVDQVEATQLSNRLKKANLLTRRGSSLNDVEDLSATAIAKGTSSDFLLSSQSSYIYDKNRRSSSNIAQGISSFLAKKGEDNTRLESLMELNNQLTSEQVGVLKDVDAGISLRAISRFEGLGDRWKGPNAIANIRAIDNGLRNPANEYAQAMNFAALSNSPDLKGKGVFSFFEEQNKGYKSAGFLSNRLKLAKRKYGNLSSEQGLMGLMTDFPEFREQPQSLRDLASKFESNNNYFNDLGKAEEFLQDAKVTGTAQDIMKGTKGVDQAKFNDEFQKGMLQGLATVGVKVGKTIADDIDAATKNSGVFVGLVGTVASAVAKGIAEGSAKLYPTDNTKK